MFINIELPTTISDSYEYEKRPPSIDAPFGLKIELRENMILFIETLDF
jgi:hypothetical protein